MSAAEVDTNRAQSFRTDSDAVSAPLCDAHKQVDLLVQAFFLSHPELVQSRLKDGDGSCVSKRGDLHRWADNLRDARD